MVLWLHKDREQCAALSSIGTASSIGTPTERNTDQPACPIDAMYADLTCAPTPPPPPLGGRPPVPTSLSLCSNEGHPLAAAHPLSPSVFSWVVMSPRKVPYSLS